MSNITQGEYSSPIKPRMRHLKKSMITDLPSLRPAHQSQSYNLVLPEQVPSLRKQNLNQVNLNIQNQQEINLSTKPRKQSSFQKIKIEQPKFHIQQVLPSRVRSLASKRPMNGKNQILVSQNIQTQGYTPSWQ